LDASWGGGNSILSDSMKTGIQSLRLDAYYRLP